MTIVHISENLERAADNHNNYLIDKGFISHKGYKGSTPMDRCTSEGASGLYFGEVIGYSPRLNNLFESWLASPTHLKVLSDPKWNWVGISVIKNNEVYVAVVNFSSGIIGSTELYKRNGNVYLTGKYLSRPTFKGDFEIKDFTLDNYKFKLEFKPYRERLIIRVKTTTGRVSDRVEVFFSEEY